MAMTICPAPGDRLLALWPWRRPVLSSTNPSSSLSTKVFPPGSVPSGEQTSALSYLCPGAVLVLSGLNRAVIRVLFNRKGGTCDGHSPLTLRVERPGARPGALPVTTCVTEGATPQPAAGAASSSQGSAVSSPV